MWLMMLGMAASQVPKAAFGQVQNRAPSQALIRFVSQLRKMRTHRDPSFRTSVFDNIITVLATWPN